MLGFESSRVGDLFPLRQAFGDNLGVPAKSTIHAVLDRHGLVKRGGGPRHRARGTPLSEGAMPNDLSMANS